MPHADGTPIFEDVVALLQAKPSPLALHQHMDILTGGVTDAANRLKNLEHGVLVNADSARVNGGKIADHETRIAGFEGDRDDLRARLGKVEAQPVEDKKRLDDLEARVRMVEGAVGSTNFAAAKEAPSTFKGPGPTEPIKSAEPRKPDEPARIF